jgi:hypothetical protein
MKEGLIQKKKEGLIKNASILKTASAFKANRGMAHSKKQIVWGVFYSEECLVLRSTVDFKDANRQNVDFLTDNVDIFYPLQTTPCWAKVPTAGVRSH